MQLVPGIKVMVSNVRVMRGLLAFTPASVQLLGGRFLEDEPAAPAVAPASSSFDDFADFDLAAIEAMEQKALLKKEEVVVEESLSQQSLRLASMQQSIKQESPRRPPSISSGSTVISPGVKKKKKRKKFLDDDDD
jgi:hypothetical protein